MSMTVVVSAVTSFLGFLLNSTILLLVLSRGRQTYHYLFAGFLFICALWDLGIFLSMIRNSYVDELPIYGNIIWWPCTFMFAIIFHFTCAYLNQPRPKRTIIVWVASAILFVSGVLGLSGKIVGVYDYSWGHIYRPDDQLLMGNLIGLPLAYFFGVSALWFLYRAHGQETSPLKRRHIAYILVSLSIVHLAVSKVAILYGIDNGFWMPACMVLNDLAVGIVGIAIVKDRLFDITVIVKKTTIYSVLATLVVVVFGVSEHLIATYVGSILGEPSMYAYLISVAAVVAVVMPVRKRVEGAVDGFFAKRTVAV
jgi:hypothetical protein